MVTFRTHYIQLTRDENGSAIVRILTELALAKVQILQLATRFSKLPINY